jgi:hypothetical protein
MTPIAESPVIAPERELQKEKKLRESELPRHPLPAVRRVAQSGRTLFFACGFQWNTFDTGGVSQPYKGC